MALAVFNTTLTDTSIAAAIRENCKPLCAGLVSEQAFADIMNHAALFPLSITPFFCFEIPLHHEKCTADFLFCISDPGALNDLFNNKAVADELLVKSHVYKGLQNFAAGWQNPKPGWNSIQNIWLEFDYADIKCGSSKPNFFYAPAKGINLLQKVHLTADALETITGQPVEKEIIKTLLYVLAKLPKPAWISQIGKMVARNDSNLRLFIQDVAKDGVTALLKVIGYRYGHNEKLTCLLGFCCKLADQVDVDIDIDKTGQLDQVVGLECSFDHLKNAFTFLDHLFSIGICKINKYEAFRKFLENMQEKDSSDFMPFLAHFKLTFSPDSDVKAKVYVGYVLKRRASSVIRTRNV